MNKGFRLASGDIIGILNSDDFYPDNNIIAEVVKAFEKNDTDSVFGDISFVSPKNINKTIRYYSSAKFHPEKFAYGYMPAHPSFFAKRKFYEKYGLFKTNYKIAADYEILIRLLYVNKLSYKYLPLSMVTMRAGGASNETLYSRYILNKEIVRACRENGIKTNLFKVSLKYFKKIFEYF